MKFYLIVEFPGLSGWTEGRKHPIFRHSTYPRPAFGMHLPLIEVASSIRPESRRANPLALVRLWICICVGVNLLGWVLAWTGQLTAIGYSVGFLLGGAFLFWMVRQGFIEVPP